MGRVALNDRLFEIGLTKQIDISAFWRSVTGETELRLSSIHECIFCETFSATLTPKANGDWFFGCSTCNREWNLYTHVRKKAIVEKSAVGSWFVDNGIIEADNVDAYTNYSMMVIKLNDFLSKLKSDFDKYDTKFNIPGETLPLSIHRAIELSEMFDGLLVQKDRPRNLRLRVLRDHFGTVSKIVAYRYDNGDKKGQAVLIDQRIHFSSLSKGGFKRSGLINLVSIESAKLIDLHSIVDEKSTLVASKGFLNSAKPTNTCKDIWMPVPVDLKVLTTEKTKDLDLQSFGYLLNFSTLNVSVVEGNRIGPPTLAVKSVSDSKQFMPLVMGLIDGGDLSEKARDEIIENTTLGGYLKSKVSLPLKKILHIDKRMIERRNFSIRHYCLENGETELTIKIEDSDEFDLKMLTSEARDMNLLYKEVVTHAILNGLPFPRIDLDKPQKTKMMRKLGAND